MGDGETVVSEAFGAVDYTSGSYGSIDGKYNHGDSKGHEQLGSVATGVIEENMDPSEHRNNDAAVNGAAEESMNLMPVENGSATDNAAAAEPQLEHDDSSVSALSAEEERLWSIVRANSLDFNAWTALIEETEKIAEVYISKIRKVYDAFLAEFPLCYGYWKKYADHESRVGAMDKVVEVYERAVLGVTYSVDIWLHYCTFAINTYGDPDTIRRLFERGLAYVGTDYLSFTLWDKYIEYEYMQQDWRQIAMIYTRILEHPILNFDRYFTSFKELAETRPLSELRSAEETTAATAAASSTADAPSTADATETVPTEFDGKANDGEVQPDVSTGPSPKSDSAGLAEREEVKKYIAVREEMYKRAKEFESKIIGFETAIRRPYFHVRSLNVAELENWHNYLDFIEKEGELNQVVKLFERCVIACANYTEYWIRYVLSMETSGSMDLAENVLARATQVFVKRQPEIHLFAARFKEQTGDIPGAQSAYQIVHSEISPGLLEATIKHANMERRLGNLENAFSLFEQAIAIEKGKEHSTTLPMLYVQYSRFLYLVSGKTIKAREILTSALEHVQPSKPLLEALIHFETIQLPPRQIDYLEPLVEKFITPNSDTQNAASASEREELSCIYIEFLGLFGDAQSIKKAEDRHAKHFLPHKSMLESKKRTADDFLSSDKAKMARTHGGAPPAQPLTGAYPNAQNQWGAAGYGAQPQTWPPAQTPVPQPWTPGYGQQAAYSAYPSAYPAPQVPAPMPQSAAYPTYPSPYPSQAYPPQSYAQPTAAAATLTPGQQPASVPQAYYGAYY